jgi:hypothetical protein
MAYRTRLLVILLIGAAVLAAGAVLFFTLTGQSGTAGSAGGDSDFPISIWIALWVVVFVPLIARRQKGEEELPPGAKVWALVLLGVVAALVLLTVHLLMV